DHAGLRDAPPNVGPEVSDSDDGIPSGYDEVCGFNRRLEEVHIDVVRPRLPEGHDDKGLRIVDADVDIGFRPFGKRERADHLARSLAQLVCVANTPDDFGILQNLTRVWIAMHSRGL